MRDRASAFRKRPKLERVRIESGSGGPTEGLLDRSRNASFKNIPNYTIRESKD